MIEEEYPGRRFVFMDSLCITDILGLLIKKIVNMKETGASFDEVVQYAENRKQEYICRFMIDDLHWLQKGGRLSNGSAFFGSLLSIKPLIYVANNGRLVVYAKCHGRRKAFAQLVADMKDSMTEDTPKEEACVIYSGTPEDAEKFHTMIMQAYPQLTNVSINTLEPVIACHTGLGFMAVVYHVIIPHNVNVKM